MSGFKADSAWRNPKEDRDPNEFTNDDMETVVGAFQAAIQQVTDQYRDEALREKALMLCNQIVVQEKPWMWTSPEGIDHIDDLFMVDEFNRDFIMLLTFTFFSRWGEANVKFTGLVDTLSWGCAADNEDEADKGFTLMSKDLSIRLSPQSTVKKYLRANKWIVVAMLIKLLVKPIDGQPAA